MPPIFTIPMQPLPTVSSAETSQIEAMHAPGAIRKRSQSLPARLSSSPSARTMSLGALQDAIEASKRVAHPDSGTVSEDVVNAFLRNAGLDVALKGARLIVTRHRDPEAAEAQRPPSAHELAPICRALMLADETPAKLDVTKALIPAVNAHLLDEIVAGRSGESLTSSAKAVVKGYFEVLGGRDLGFDDAIAAVNIYLFDRIGDNKALGRGNIAAAVLTASLMLVPTIGKNLPVIAEAIREKRYQDAIIPAISILAISAMTLNPTLAALGRSQASAVAAATGNVLMMANLPATLREGHDWFSLFNTDVDPRTRPFTHFAREHGLVDKGLHTAIDFLHEFAAQTGFLVLNVINVAQGGGAAGNPASFPLLGTLLGSFAANAIRGDQPFTDFAADRTALAETLTAPGGASREQAARIFLQQKIAQTYDPAGYAPLIAPFLEQSSGDHVTRQLAQRTISDATETAFLKGLMDRFCSQEEAKDAAHGAIDRIYRFESFDPTEAAGDDRTLGEILRFVQTERNRDKGYVRAARGIALADNVYRNVVAHAIKCAAFEEFGHRDNTGNI